jgi:hypothetical protein
MANGGSARVKSKNAFPQGPIQLAPLSSSSALCGAVLQPYPLRARASGPIDTEESRAPLSGHDFVVCHPYRW